MTVLADDCRTLDVDGVRAMVLGSGDPVTVLAHGLGGSAAETRPLAARLRGTRVLLEFRGHGASAALPGGWHYDLLAHDLGAVADAAGATRALGLSLGSGALLRLLLSRPERFERLAFVLPAAIDDQRADGATLRLQRLGAAIDGGELDTVSALLLEEVPAAARARRGTALLLRRRAAAMLERPSPQPLFADRPVRDVGQLRQVTAAALVVGQEGDPLHRLDVAVDLARALPHGQLLTVPPGGVFWTAPRVVQDALTAHLTPETP